VGIAPTIGGPADRPENLSLRAAFGRPMVSVVAALADGDDDLVVGTQAHLDMWTRRVGRARPRSRRLRCPRCRARPRARLPRGTAVWAADDGRSVAAGMATSWEDRGGSTSNHGTTHHRVQNTTGSRRSTIRPASRFPGRHAGAVRHRRYLDSAERSARSTKEHTSDNGAAVHVIADNDVRVAVIVQASSYSAASVP
jgi:hypothetical protein